MPQASQKITIERSPTQVFSVLQDFLSYPHVFSQVKEVKILEKKNSEQKIYLVVDLMEPIACTMLFQSQEPHELRWSLVESDLLKKNQGSWKISEIKPGVCEVTYATEVELNIWVPDVLLQSVVQMHLPDMLQSLKREVEKRYV